MTKDSLEQRLEDEEKLDEEYCEECSELLEDCSCDDEDDEDEEELTETNTPRS